MLVFDMIGLHIVFTYSRMGQVIALNIESINFFCLTYLVEVSAFRMLSVYFALVIDNDVIKISVFGLTVIPRIFECILLVFHRV